MIHAGFDSDESSALASEYVRHVSVKDRVIRSQCGRRCLIHPSIEFPVGSSDSSRVMHSSE